MNSKKIWIRRPRLKSSWSLYISTKEAVKWQSSSQVVYGGPARAAQTTPRQPDSGRPSYCLSHDSECSRCQGLRQMARARPPARACRSRTNGLNLALIRIRSWRKCSQSLTTHRIVPNQPQQGVDVSEIGGFTFPGFQPRRWPLANVVRSPHRSVTATKFELSFHLYRQS